MERLLNEHELAQFQQWINQAAGAGTGMVPGDLSLLMSHIRAQSNELQRLRGREASLVDALNGLLDYVEHGGSDDYRQEVVAQAMAARHG